MQNSNWLNFIIILTCIALAAGLARWMGTQNPPEETVTTTIHQAADFNLPDSNGRMHRLSDYRGKNIVINFWASWCAPCVTEFPILLSTAQEQPDTIFLLISIDDDLAQITHFKSRLPGQYQSASDQDNVIILQDVNRRVMQDNYKIDQIPETFVLDAHHNIRRHWQGSSFTKNELVKILSELSTSP